MRNHFCVLSVAFCLAIVSACAPRRVTLPTDSGTPLPDFAAVHAQITAACRDVRTLTAEVGLRGRAGDQRLSGRVVAGFERPASMRLEAVGPFGRTAFILAARDSMAVLLFPSDARVVRGQKPEEILGALIGVPLAPADMQAILTGCVVPASKPESGRLHANNWASIDLAGDARMYLRRSTSWELRAAHRNGWQIEYTMGQGRFPQSVRLVSDGQTVNVDLTATLSQVEANTGIDPAAFAVKVPPDATAMTLDELRDVGPLRGQ
jgi:outer membrane biogenesis lipoprotein LolB